MSFSRLSVDSAVYTFPTDARSDAEVLAVGVGGTVYECCFCSLLPESGRFLSLDDFLAHMQAHRDAGDAVPDSVEHSAREWAADQATP